MAKKKKGSSAEGEGAEDEAAEEQEEADHHGDGVRAHRRLRGQVVLLKPKPLTPAQVAAAAELADAKLANTCASHNGLPTKPLPDRG